MTAPAPETTPTTGGGNFFTQKWGPLPVWAWMAIAASSLLIISYLRNKQNSSTSTGINTSDTGASQIPQFINQTYTSASPPNVSQAVTVSGSPASNPSVPVKLGQVTKEAVVKKGQSRSSIARQWGVPANAVFIQGNHAWTYAAPGNPKEGPTASGKLGPGETIQSLANKWGVSAQAIQQSGSNVWTYSPRANTKSQTLDVQTPSTTAGT